MKDLLPAALGALIRAGLQALAGMGVAVAPDMEGKLVAVAVFLGTAAWSLWQKYKAKK